MDTPPYDAVVRDMLATAHLQDVAAVLSLAPPGVACEENENVQPRPLRSEHFFHWLETVERSIVQRRQTPEALERQDVSAHSLVAVSSEIRFKLRRWPAVALLRNDPQRLRMAALLARRFLTPAELASLLHAGSSENLTFLRVLQACALLETTAPLHGLAGPLEAFPADRPAGAYARMAQGVIHGIRRRLGL